MKLTRPGATSLQFAAATDDDEVEQMTWRAKSYLGVGALRHLVVAGSMIFVPGSFDSPAFTELFNIAPYWFWVVSLTLGGLHLAYSALTRSESHARTALTLSAAVSFMWAGAFGLVVLEGSASMLATVIFSALGLKDLIVCAQPLRSPFERLGSIYEGASGPARKT